MISPTPRVMGVTGANGFVGRRLMQKLLSGGWTVRALVRSADAFPFDGHEGVVTVEGDIRDPKAVVDAVSGSHAVIHLAAKVTDWGDYREFQDVTVSGTAHVLDACQIQSVPRLVHVSSDAVYGYHVGHRGADETTPLTNAPQDPYTRSKIEAEGLCSGATHTEVAIARPGWIWGPHDHTVFPRLLEFLDSPLFFYAGAGTNVLNLAYVDNVCDALVLLATHPAAAGHTFNVNDGERVTARVYFEAIRAALSLKPRPSIRVPYGIAHGVAHAVEGVGRLLGLDQPPPLTRFLVDCMFSDMDFVTHKLKSRLGFKPLVPWQVGLQRLSQWWRRVQSVGAAPDDGVVHLLEDAPGENVVNGEARTSARLPSDRIPRHGHANGE